MNTMRDFSWKYFTLTGDVESFMLYKEMDHYGKMNHADSPAGTGDDVDMMDDEEISG